MPGERSSSDTAGGGEGTTTGAGAAASPTRRLAALLGLVTLYVGAAMVAAPARPQAMTDFFASRQAGHPVRCGGTGGAAGGPAPPPPPTCGPARAAAVAWAAGTDFLANCLLATALAPALGSASDAAGARVPFLAAGLAAGALPPAALWAHLARGASLLLYFPASAASTALPGAALIFACVADALPPAGRAAGFGAVGAALWVGVIGGSLLGGRLAPATAAGVATVGTACAAALAALALPETLKREGGGEEGGEGGGGGGGGGARPPPPPSAFRAFTARAGAAAAAGGSPWAGLRLLARHPLYARLTAIVLLTGAVADGSSEVLAQFLQARVAGGFSPADQGRLLASLGGACLGAQALALPALLRAGVPEAVILGLGLAGAAAQCAGLAAWGGLSAGGATALVATAGGLSSLAAPAIAALKANAAGEGEQGAVQGALAGARAAAAGVGPVLFAAAFWLGGRPGKGGGGEGTGAGPWPGAPYALGTALSLAALWLARGVAGDAAAVAAAQEEQAGGGGGGGGDGDGASARWARAGAAERVGLLVRGRGGWS